MRHLRTITPTGDTAASTTGAASASAGVLGDLLLALLAVLGTGDVRIAHRDLGALASAYFPDTGLVELNPAASLELQAAGLVHGLRAIAAHHERDTTVTPAVAVGATSGATGGGVSPSARPSLRLVPGGAR